MEFKQAAKDQLAELEKQAEQKKKELSQIQSEVKALKKYMTATGILERKKRGSKKKKEEPPEP